MSAVCARRLDLSSLRRIFEWRKGLFVAVHPQMSDVKLIVTEKRCSQRKCAWRDFAWAFPSAHEVWVSDRAISEQLHPANLSALLDHELGHIAVPDADERGADAEAERVTGDRIFYDGRDVQVHGRGRWPRPEWLHQ